MTANRKAAAAAPKKERPDPARFFTLWQANMLIGPRRDHFLFRCTDDFELASVIAQELMDSSPGAEMVGAKMTGIEIKGHLKN